MNYFTLVFILFIFCTSTIQLWLAHRQSANALRHRHQVPDAFRSRVSLAIHQKAADYTAAKMRLEQIDTLVGSLLVLIWTLGGGLNYLAGLWANSGWGDVAAGTGLMVTTFLVMALLDIPLDAYGTFVVEVRFGFNRTSLRLYIADTLKQGALLTLLGTPLIALLLWLVSHAGKWWWLYGWLTWLSFTAIMLWLYPTVIAPLFNRFTPLEDDALRDRIERLLQRSGFNSSGIFVMDGSKRSQHGNAYFTGFGANKRIVFFDTLLKCLKAEELESVFAHELGHFKYGHVRKRLLFMAVTSLVAFVLLGILIDADWFYTGLGLQHFSHAGTLLLFLMIAPYFTAPFRPLSAYWMRKHEFEADDFAATHADAQNLIFALVKLYRENATTLTPDALYSAYHDSHPPAPIRISHLIAKLNNS